MKENRHGIEGRQAPELRTFKWIDEEGKDRRTVRLAEFENKFIVLFCFQSWCPGCHSRGFPALQEMTKALAGNDKVVFLAIQTVFEGKVDNNFQKLRIHQKEYKLAIPFGQDEGSPQTKNISSVMYDYHTGGTPWFIFISPDRKVVFNDFHINVEHAINYLQNL